MISRSQAIALGIAALLASSCTAMAHDAERRSVIASASADKPVEHAPAPMPASATAPEPMPSPAPFTAIELESAAWEKVSMHPPLEWFRKRLVTDPTAKGMYVSLLRHPDLHAPNLRGASPNPSLQRTLSSDAFG
jgi:hypothetical protein